CARWGVPYWYFDVW
nr:immunoglobulin heavy chain junction region [Mus musculus]MBK4187840.1 immunoglobulin heavy chain junction region [Mus musculus]MBK4188930.1 immunoglobulin heavy chain junction region [Mus musculus]MBK4188931.1 immunoglobulin heavy chain junction region [Mus musculus]MBK4188932.1 immunoglobulin heavy chain junction region [Mus musculus]